MRASSVLTSVLRHEAVNFVLTNRIPRALVTQFIGWFSRIEHPLVRDLSIGAWKFFAPDLNLHEARRTDFASLHDCFIRELRPEVRPIDSSPDVLVSPCDGIIGASGRLAGSTLLQCKGSAYSIDELLGDARLCDAYRDGTYVTLRLTSSMYHRFHAPFACRISEVVHFPGDTWNVNPATLRRIDHLFCRNERAILPMSLEGSTESVVLVPVAAILVASLRFTFLEVALNAQYQGPYRISCDAVFRKGDELGHFEHGSTIIVLGSRGLELCGNACEGATIRMGEALLRHRKLLSA